MEQGIDFIKLVCRGDDKDTADEDIDAETDTRKKISHCAQEGDDTEKHKENDVQNSKREAMAEGSVGGKIYWNYFKAGDSLCQISFLVAAFLVNQLIISGTDYWLSIW